MCFLSPRNCFIFSISASGSLSTMTTSKDGAFSCIFTLSIACKRYGALKVGITTDIEGCKISEFSKSKLLLTSLVIEKLSLISKSSRVLKGYANSIFIIYYLKFCLSPESLF